MWRDGSMPSWLLWWFGSSDRRGLANKSRRDRVRSVHPTLRIARGSDIAWPCNSLTQYRDNQPPTLCAASRMTLVTAFGCEIIERCPPLTFVTLAWARVAMNSWTFGG